MQEPKNSPWVKVFYLIVLVFFILLSIYLYAERSKLLSSSAGAQNAGTTAQCKAAFRDDEVLEEGLSLEIANAGGFLLIEARKGAERCYQVEGFRGCLSLATTPPDQAGDSFLSGTYPPGGFKSVNTLEAQEGSIYFESIKDAIQWIDSESNRAFNFIYDDRGLAVGWYEPAAPGPGRMFKVRVWQVYIDGEKPEMLPGSGQEKMKIAKRAVEISAAAPQPVSAKARAAAPVSSKKKKADPPLWEKMGREYCVQRKSEEFGEQSELNQEKRGIAVPFFESTNEQVVQDLGMSLLKPTLDNWIAEKDNINFKNSLPVKDPAKVHLSLEGDAYYVPDDIGDWVREKRHVVITGKWFKYDDVDYLYVSAGLDAKGFVAPEGGDKEILNKTEAVYMFVNNRHGEVIMGSNMDVLRIENNLLIMGVGNYGHEGANGKVIGFDGNRSFAVCSWGSGI